MIIDHHETDRLFRVALRYLLSDPDMLKIKTRKQLAHDIGCDPAVFTGYIKDPSDTVHFRNPKHRRKESIAKAYSKTFDEFIEFGRSIDQRLNYAYGDGGSAISRVGFGRRATDAIFGGNSESY